MDSSVDTHSESSNFIIQSFVLPLEISLIHPEVAGSVALYCSVLFFDEHGQNQGQFLSPLGPTCIARIVPQAIRVFFSSDWWKTTLLLMMSFKLSPVI